MNRYKIPVRDWDTSWLNGVVLMSCCVDTQHS